MCAMAPDGYHRMTAGRSDVFAIFASDESVARALRGGYVILMTDGKAVLDRDDIGNRRTDIGECGMRYVARSSGDSRPGRGTREQHAREDRGCKATRLQGSHS